MKTSVKCICWCGCCCWNAHNICWHWRAR